jgi:transposase
VYLSLKGERALAAEATDRLDDDRGLSQPAVAANLARFRRPNPTLFWFHRHTWEQLDRYARGVDRTPRERLTGVIATYLAAMVRKHGSEWTARKVYEAKARPGA